jgi:hypothetical protein
MTSQGKCAIHFSTGSGTQPLGSQSINLSLLLSGHPTIPAILNAQEVR